MNGLCFLLASRGFKVSLNTNELWLHIWIAPLFIVELKAIFSVPCYCAIHLYMISSFVVVKTLNPLILFCVSLNYVSDNFIVQWEGSVRCELLLEVGKKNGSNSIYGSRKLASTEVKELGSINRKLPHPWCMSLFPPLPNHCLPLCRDGGWEVMNAATHRLSPAVWLAAMFSNYSPCVRPLVWLKSHTHGE